MLTLNVTSSQCKTCEMVFATPRGLEYHLKRSKKYSCGQEAFYKKKLARIKESRERKAEIYGQKLRRIGPHFKNVSTRHKRGAPLTKFEKEVILRLYDQFRGLTSSPINFA